MKKVAQKFGIWLPFASPKVFKKSKFPRRAQNFIKNYFEFFKSVNNMDLLKNNNDDKFYW